MTGPVEPSRPEREPEGSGQAEGGATAPERPTPPPPERPSPTGWTGAPRPGGLTPGSVPGSGPRTESLRLGPAGSGPGLRPQPAPPAAPLARPAGPPSSGAPVRPPVPAGVPPRSAPLPPPRETTRPDPPRPGARPETPRGDVPRPDVAGSLAATTVVPERPPRRPPPRPGRPGVGSPARGRRATLAVKRLDPWSVFVTSLVLSLLLAVATIVAAFLLYAALSAMGVPESINSNIGDITKKGDLVTQWRFVGLAALISAANVVLLTGLATVGSMIYNLVATFTGGLELTLSEKE